MNTRKVTSSVFAFVNTTALVSYSITPRKKSNVLLRRIMQKDEKMNVKRQDRQFRWTLHIDLGCFSPTSLMLLSVGGKSTVIGKVAKINQRIIFLEQLGQHQERTEHLPRSQLDYCLQDCKNVTSHSSKHLQQTKQNKNMKNWLL